MPFLSKHSPQRTNPRVQRLHTPPLPETLGLGPLVQPPLPDQSMLSCFLCDPLGHTRDFLSPQHGREWPCRSTALPGPVPPWAIPSVCALVFLWCAVRVHSSEAVRRGVVPVPRWSWLHNGCMASLHAASVPPRVSPPPSGRDGSTGLTLPERDTSLSRAGPLCTSHKPSPEQGREIEETVS